MSVNDIKVFRNGGSVLSWITDNRSAGVGGGVAIARTLKPGEIVACTPTNSAYAYRAETSTPLIGTDVILGIVVRESTETSSANGEVEFQTIISGQTVLEGAASTVANVDTAAELLTYLGNYILLDASATKFDTATDGVLTIDEDDTDDPNKNGLCLIDGSADADGLCRVWVHANVLASAPWIGQTID